MLFNLRSRERKRHQSPNPSAGCHVWLPCLGGLSTKGSYSPHLFLALSLALSFFSLVCFTFKWNVKPFDSGVVSYLIYFICGIYSSVLPRLRIQFLAFLFSCFCCCCHCCCWCLSILMSFNWHGSGSGETTTVSASDLLSIPALYASLPLLLPSSSYLSLFYYFFMLAVIKVDKIRTAWCAF